MLFKQDRFLNQNLNVFIRNGEQVRLVCLIHCTSFLNIEILGEVERLFRKLLSEHRIRTGYDEISLPHNRENLCSDQSPYLKSFPFAPMFPKL